MTIPKNAIKVFSGKLYDTYHREQEMFDGTLKIFEGLRGTDAAQILLIFDDGEVGIGYEEQPGRSPFFGLLGGMIEPGEDPSRAIIRELSEETGLGCDELIPYKVFTVAKTITRYFHCFLGRGVKEVSEPHPESGEKVEVIKISVEELLEIMAGPYFRTKDFALDIFKEFYKGGISRVRAVLGIWDGIEDRNIELIEDNEKHISEIIRKSPTKKKITTKKAKKVSIKPKKVIIKKTSTKISKNSKIKKTSVASIFKAIKPKKEKDFKSFLDEMEKNIKKKEAEFEEPLF